RGPDDGRHGAGGHGDHVHHVVAGVAVAVEVGAGGAGLVLRALHHGKAIAVAAKGDQRRVEVGQAAAHDRVGHRVVDARYPVGEVAIVVQVALEVLPGGVRHPPVPGGVEAGHGDAAVADGAVGQGHEQDGVGGVPVAVQVGVVLVRLDHPEGEAAARHGDDVAGGGQPQVVQTPAGAPKFDDPVGGVAVAV